LLGVAEREIGLAQAPCRRFFLGAPETSRARRESLARLIAEHVGERPGRMPRSAN
jgi:hypothetical protein